ncbi:hypothetical protein DMC30DRAFT_402182 [Rhodotorula diobovata]|uniref:Uncharacterized protein n=1 Tax=Rhodotorula diobovata TaxID=5288 RepID=A0A5C5FS60_9BASI|nr:hypothetical protein DMC30DRAFT_402182 [Rhodotorula diobovata]
MSAPEVAPAHVAALPVEEPATTIIPAPVETPATTTEPTHEGEAPSSPTEEPAQDGATTPPHKKGSRQPFANLKNKLFHSHSHSKVSTSSLARSFSRALLSQSPRARPPSRLPHTRPALRSLSCSGCIHRLSRECTVLSTSTLRNSRARLARRSRNLSGRRTRARRVFHVRGGVVVGRGFRVPERRWPSRLRSRAWERLAKVVGCSRGVQGSRGLRDPSLEGGSGGAPPLLVEVSSPRPTPITSAQR